MDFITENVHFRAKEFSDIINLTQKVIAFVREKSDIEEESLT